MIRPEPDELFVEIGSGTGQLTLPIAAAGAQVVAIEVDRELAAAAVQKIEQVPQRRAERQTGPARNHAHDDR